MSEKQETIGNPHLEGYRLCSYCRKYYDETRHHACYMDPTIPCPAHNRRHKSDKKTYVKSEDK